MRRSRRNVERDRCVLPQTEGFSAAFPRRAPPDWVGGRSMRDEIYRVVYWVGMAALVVWTVYSAYSAFSFS
jgi:hypothetical protein